MTRGPHYYDAKGYCIYCGDTEAKLTNEHVVPYSLGGNHVLREASCLSCADITKKFEQDVARDLWGDARIAFDAPSRRKKTRPKKIRVPKKDQGSKKLEVPASECPGTLVFYKMAKAGLLQGLPENVDISGFWKLIAISDDKRLENFKSKYQQEPTMQFRHVPLSFGRLIAKIGYCQAMTELDPTDFRPFCLPFILGDNSNVSYVVGGTLDEPPAPDKNNGYKLGLSGFGYSERVVLVAQVRLYANTHTPEYHVVVGDVSGRENVNRFLRKVEGFASIQGLGTSNGATASTSEHWAPDIWPLPYWLNT